MTSRAEYLAQRLARMIRCRTVSVKGSYDDTEFAKLRGVVEDLFPLVHQRMERRIFSEDCWVYELKGKNPSRNLMLMSHHDVAAAEGTWAHGPFAAEIADGKLWGRGTVDTKTPLFAEFTALEELLAEGWEPPCSVFLGSSHNEELGGDGIPTALAYFKERGLTFELVLDEGGAIIDPPLSGMTCGKCAMVAVHEKGRYKLDCTASAASVHTGLSAASTASPIERMVGFLDEAASGKLFIRRLNPQVQAMFRHLAPHCRPPMGLVLGSLWLTAPLLQRIIPKLAPQAGAMLGTVCGSSRITGDDKSCTATVSFKAVDEGDMARDLDALREAAKKYGVDITIDPASEYHGPADMTRPAFAYVMERIRAVFPNDPPIPFILPAGTDARWLTDICPCVLRFAPIRLSAQQLASVHSENENIDLDAIADAVTFYTDLLRHHP